jgi:hypothetical protein
VARQRDVLQNLVDRPSAAGRLEGPGGGRLVEPPVDGLEGRLDGGPDVLTQVGATKYGTEAPGTLQIIDPSVALGPPPVILRVARTGVPRTPEPEPVMVAYSS